MKTIGQNQDEMRSLLFEAAGKDEHWALLELVRWVRDGKITANEATSKLPKHWGVHFNRKGEPSLVSIPQ